MQISADVRGFSVGAGLIGGAAAVALTLGLGGAHVGVADQRVSLMAADGNSDSTDLLIIASANLVQAKDAITGIETADLSDTVLSFVEAMHPMSNGLDRFALFLDNKIAPAESTILAHSGSMASLIDQLFFAPLNQQWAYFSESMLDAIHALDEAAEYDSISGAFSADFRMLGIGYFQIIPTALASMPVMWIADLFDEAVPAPDPFDFSA